jgi:hypothetical protein
VKVECGLGDELKPVKARGPDLRGQTVRSSVPVPVPVPVPVGRSEVAVEAIHPIDATRRDATYVRTYGRGLVAWIGAKSESEHRNRVVDFVTPRVTPRVTR